VVDNRKKAISIRMSTADVRCVKKLAQRLNVRDSDVIRFAVKGMLARLGPLYEPETQGRNLVPVLVEAGAEFLRFFELDANRLDTIINGDVGPEQRVAREDLVLLALSGVQEPYAALKLSELNNTDERLLRSTDLLSSIRQYLYDKYIYRVGSERESASPIRFAIAAGAHHE
jgi:hypothetical protein